MAEAGGVQSVDRAVGRAGVPGPAAAWPGSPRSRPRSACTSPPPPGCSPCCRPRAGGTGRRSAGRYRLGAGDPAAGRRHDRAARPARARSADLCDGAGREARGDGQRRGAHGLVAINVHQSDGGAVVDGRQLGGPADAAARDLVRQGAAGLRPGRAAVPGGGPAARVHRGDDHRSGHPRKPSSPRPRQAGFAITVGELEDGLNAVAAPVRDHRRGRGRRALGVRPGLPAAGRRPAAAGAGHDGDRSGHRASGSATPRPR